MTTEGFRLSPQQGHLWAFHEAGARAGFRAVARVDVRGPLDADLLGRALERVVEEHEILRTTYTDAPDGGPVQVVGAASAALEEIDLGEASSAEQDERIEELYASACRAPLGVVDAAGAAERGPVLRVTRIRRGPDRHALLIGLPALGADRAALANLVAELARAYGELREGGSYEVDAAQYADVAEWQIELLESPESRPGLRYWRERELGAGVDLALPFQRVERRAATAGAFAVRSVRRAIAPSLAARVAAAAERHGVAERVFLLGAWVTLLRRLGRESAVLVGVGADGRRHEELADAIGLLARHLPLPLDLDAGTSFAELVGRLAAEVEDMERWQECFRWEASAPGSAPSLLPFCFEYDAGTPELSAGDLTFALERSSVRFDRFECRLTCARRAGALEVTLDYDEEAFGAATVERLAGQLETLLASAAERPDDPIGELDVLAASEWQALVVDFNATRADYPRGRCAHEWIEEHARRTPDAVAVRQGEQALTYGELDARANRLAHHLRGQGVGPDTLVALCVERSVEMVVAIVGILKAGGAYVPVDPAYPEDRIRFLLEDTRAPVLVTQEKLAAAIPAPDPPDSPGGARRVLLDADAAAIARHPTDAPASGVVPDNLVYVIYTSGSTGKPKGVVITHEKLVISNSARVARFGHTPQTFLLLSSFAFDSSVVGLFWTLCGGGTLLLIPEGVEKDLPRIPRIIAEDRVSHLLTLPSFYNLILEQARPEQLAGMHTVIVAGEACPIEMVERHRRTAPGVGLFSEYGATETTVFSSVYDCLAQTLPIAPVGDPIDNAQMYVLDESLRPCPTGVPGEVHFGGIALALGYWRRPGLTAERFVPHPFVQEPGERLYKSGDLARHLENGDVEFLGRLDNQVKIRGYRIELEEIEIALVAHPRLRETVVLALADRSEGKRLVGYVVPDGSPAPSVTELREFLAEKLPDYMVPAVFVFLDDMPRTPNGKVDRKALPEPGSERPELDSTFEAPRSEAEKALAAVWADVLGIERVGVHDNFFELGGDSILSIQVVSRAKRAGVKLTPRQVFENQTVAELAAVATLAPIATGALSDAGAAEEQGAVVGPVAPTPVQRWFYELDLPEPAHWNMPMLLEVERPPAPSFIEHLEAALGALLAHHDALRLRARRTDAGWRQEIAPVEPPSGGFPEARVEVEDLSGVPEERQAAELEERAAVHQAALDLERGPLMRVVLFERGAGRSPRLLWIVHHLVVDGVSWRILLEDLETALDQLERGEPVRLPAKTTSVQRWASCLEEYARGPKPRAEAERWIALVGDGGPALPLDHPDGRGGGNDEASARKVRAALGEDETHALLTEVPKAYNTQIGDVLLTALVHAFCEWTGEDSLLLNLEGHGREEVVEGVDLSRTVGWFTTDFPVLLRDVAPWDPGKGLRSMKEQLFRIPEQGFGFGVARHLGPDDVADALRRLPRPVVGFNYLGQFDQVFRDGARFRMSAEPSGPSQSPRGERVFVMEVYGAVAGGRLELDFEYSANLHERSTIEALAQGFVRNLRALIEHCLSPEAGGFTASDFADFKWSESDLEGIANAIRKSQEGVET